MGNHMLGIVRIPSSNSVYTSLLFPKLLFCQGFFHCSKCISYACFETRLILGQKRMSTPTPCLHISWCFTAWCLYSLCYFMSVDEYGKFFVDSVYFLLYPVQHRHHNPATIASLSFAGWMSDTRSPLWLYSRFRRKTTSDRILFTNVLNE